MRARAALYQVLVRSAKDPRATGQPIDTVSLADRESGALEPVLAMARAGGYARVAVVSFEGETADAAFNTLDRLDVITHLLGQQPLALPSDVRLEWTCTGEGRLPRPFAAGDVVELQGAWYVIELWGFSAAFGLEAVLPGEDGPDGADPDASGLAFDA